MATQSKECWVFPFQEAELQRVKKVRELELVYARAQLELEVSKAQQLAEVEVKKFKQMTEALGPSTIRDLAVAGPEMQVRWGESAGMGVCVYVFVCVSWDHIWNQEGRAGEANTTPRKMSGTEGRGEVVTWTVSVSRVIRAWCPIRHSTRLSSERELLRGQ